MYDPVGDSLRRRIVAAYGLTEEDVAGLEELEQAERDAEFTRQAYVEYLRGWQERVEAALGEILLSGREPDAAEIEAIIASCSTDDVRPAL